MKILLLTTFFFLGFFLNAQITITSADFGDSGDTVRISVAADLEIDFTTTGSDQVWDYSGLIAESQYLKHFSDITEAGNFAGFLFGQFASPKYQASYFNKSTALPLDQIGDFLPLPIDSFNLVSRLTTDSLTSIGTIISVGGNMIPVKSDTIETRFAFPLNFGDTHFSRGYTYLDMNPIQNAIWIQYRTRNTEVDGWGIVSTPFGTFNALRVRHEITENDSLFIEFSGFGFWVPIPVPLSREYEWWTNGEKEPVLKIMTNQIQGTETVTSVEYKDLYRGLDAGLEENLLSVSVSPNPTQGKVDFITESPISKLRIYSVNGHLIKELAINNQISFSIDLTDQAKGVYFVEGFSDKGTFRTRIIRD
jgi:hypothetical protein